VFAGRTSIIVTALCTLIGVVALVTIGVLTLTGGSEFTEFALVMVFFVSFLIGSYWWIIFGPGRYL
jgi:ABC-type spermidine/putrescine transport system permease subunit I